MTTRIARLALAALAAAALFAAVYVRRYPADTTPEGAYLRLAKHLELGQPELAFSYLEVDARDAAYVMARARTDALARVRQAFPAEEARAFASSYAALATGDDGPKAFARYAEPRGWLRRLAKDVSPIDHVEAEGDRATVVTRKGTRYPFHKDRDGRYGLTSFTAELVAQAKQATRDLEVVGRSAEDYERRRAGEGAK
jgi:hypothetical protein